MEFTFKNSDKFFGDNGLTSTSANFLANKAKELVKSLELSNFSLISTEVEMLSTGRTAIVKKGKTKQEFEEIKSNLDKTAKLNSLIAWLREAIKAKEFQLEEVENFGFSTWMRVFYPNISLINYGAEVKDNPQPEKPSFSVDKYIVENFSVKDINEYLMLNSTCAVIGKFIHPDGVFSRERARAFEEEGQVYIENKDGMPLVYTKGLSVPKEEIDKTFFNLQELHREFQKRLNKIRFDVERELQEQKDKYQKEYSRYQSIEYQNDTLINAAKAKFMEEFENWKIDNLNKIRDKKIIIPNDLKEIYDQVSKIS